MDEKKEITGCVCVCATTSVSRKHPVTTSICLIGGYLPVLSAPQRLENRVTSQESMYKRSVFLMNPLLPLHSFPLLESSILISLACSGAHPYFSCLIHNSNRNSKDQLSCYFFHSQTIAHCAFAPLAGGQEEHCSLQILSP